MQETINSKNEYHGMYYIKTPSINKKGVLLILHGWMQTKETWIEPINELSKDYCVICPDLPGFGESINDKNFFKFDPEAYSDFLYNFLKENGIERVSILGHSYGGRIAITMAEKYKEIVTNLIIYASPGMETRNSLYYKSIDAFHAFSNVLVKIKGVESIKNRLKEKIGSRDYKASGIREELFLNAVKYNVSNHLNEITARTLIIWGDKDEELDVSQAYLFKESIKGSSIYILKTYGHFAHMQTPILFAKIISKFLNNEEIN